MASRPPSPKLPPPDPAGNKPSGPPRRMSMRGWIILWAAILLFNIFFYSNDVGGKKQGPQLSLTYTALLKQANAGHIKNATITGSTIAGDFKSPFKSGKKTYTRYTATVVSEVLDTVTSTFYKDGINITLKTVTPPAWLSALGLILQALPLLFLLAIFYFAARQARNQTQGVFGFGRSKAKLYTEERPDTTFADVAGVNAAKDELEEIVHFLKDPTIYTKLGAHIPKGVLLVGPPGTGKTLLARAVAGEARVPFFSISATEFVEMFVGVGASRVRDLFDKAREAAPAIMFVDEIDAIGGHRGGGAYGGSNDERDQTLNQLLVSMDGFETNEAVVVMAATNRPDTLDPALLRPGRFDRQVTVDPPDRAGREAILKIHTRNIPLAPDVDLAALARATPGMSGADLANLANEAALAAARHGHDKVYRADFDEALDRITLGAAGTPLMNEEERKTVAYHEAGHALVAYLLPNVDPVNRITITPRGRSLGVTQFLPIDERRNYRREFLLNRMAVGLGGRTAEELVFEDITSGAENDLQGITRIARAMVTQLGMANDLGPIYFGNSSDDGMSGRAYSPFAPKEYGDDTANRLDHAIAALISEAHERAMNVLSANRAALDAVAAALLHEESLDSVQFAQIADQARLPAPPRVIAATPHASD